MTNPSLGQVRMLIDWLEKRGQPDSGINYRASNSWQDAYLRIDGPDADFIAKHFHGQGARDLLAAILASLDLSPAELKEEGVGHIADAGKMVPDGWVLVPREPLPEMLAAWYRYKNGHHWPDEPPPVDTSDYGAYRSMLAAAPSPVAYNETPSGDTQTALSSTDETQAPVPEPQAVAWPGRSFCEIAGRNADKLAERVWNKEDKQVALDAALAIRTLLADPLSGGGKVDLLAEMAKHLGWELDWGSKDNADEEGDFGWRVHECRGNRSDREWTLIGFGDTPADALTAALSTMGGKQP